MAERFQFHHRQQAELMADYMVELQELALHWQFGAYLLEALRDQLVCEMLSVTQQKCLLEEHDLTFNQALVIAQSIKTDDRNTH